jgi:DNA helicase-4
LYSQGIPYEYERAYEHETANENYRQYKPDFYFPDINLYLEHYAVDQNGKPPAHFGQKYLDEMKWKSETHQKYKTDLISTTFHEFITGSMFKKLEYELQTRGQIFQPRSLNALIKHSPSTRMLMTFGSFLSHYKSNQASVIKLLENPSLTLRQSYSWNYFQKFMQSMKEL